MCCLQRVKAQLLCLVPGAAAPQQFWSVTGGLSFLEPPTVLSWFPFLY